MKSLLPSRSVLRVLFLFNLAVAIWAAFGLHGSQRVMTSVGMGVVALGAGAALLLRRAPQPNARPLPVAKG